ncbi:MAG: preprotein translocase subunit SecG [Cocleimonas sp.]
MFYNVMLIIQILVSLGIIGLVLIQHGKGADAGAAFGGGASGTVFGSRGSGNFLTKLTTGLAVVFFANSLMLAWLVAHPDSVDGRSIIPTAVTETLSTDNTAPTPEVDVPGGSAPVKVEEEPASQDVPK